MCVLIFSTNLSQIFFILRRTERDIIKNVYWSLGKVHFILDRFILNFNFLDRFSKNTHIKFHKNASSGSRVVPCGQMDGHEFNGRISQFFESA